MPPQVIQLTRDDLRWSLHTDEAQIACPVTKVVDPFPAYPHDPALVKETLAGLPQFELQPTRVWLLPVEILARTNGWAEPGSEWDADEGKYLWTPGEIVMPAKRIPPHPAVTRYTVAHETGHHACHQLEKMRGQQPHAPVDEDGGVLHEYAKIRRLDLEACFQYGGGLWHQHVAELMACDWRIFVAGVEPEFWPHPGFTRPEKLKGVQRFWTEEWSRVEKPAPESKRA